MNKIMQIKLILYQGEAIIPVANLSEDFVGVAMVLTSRNTARSSRQVSVQFIITHKKT